jgi:hypothetical protein
MAGRGSLSERVRVARGLERLDAHIAMGGGPLVGLLGEQGADQAGSLVLQVDV